MKRNLFCLIIILLTTRYSITAQTYHPFPTKNAMWTEMYTYPWPDEHSVFHCFALKDNDTTIKGNLYHKLYHSTDTIFTEDKLVGGLREDNKKVYYYSIVPVSFSPDYPYTDIPKDTEVLLYDFSFNVGDTIINYCYFPECYKIRVTPGLSLLFLSKIDSVYVGDEYRRRFYFGLTDSTDWIIQYNPWVEGIGQLRGLLFPVGDLGMNGFWNDIVCFRDGYNVLYHCNERCSFSYNDCYYILDEISPNSTVEDVKISPNPVTDKVNIKLSVNKFDRLTIINIFGTEVKEYQVSNNSKLEINREGLSPGMYFIRLSGKTSKTVNTKIIFK